MGEAGRLLNDKREEMRRFWHIAEDAVRRDSDATIVLSGTTLAPIRLLYYNNVKEALPLKNH